MEQEKIPFKLKADYAPAGDQPQAIEKLVEGLQEGLAHQTLLGVTGSGKSVGCEEPLLLAERVRGRLRARFVSAGAFIDGLIAASGPPAPGEDGTERLACTSRGFFTPAYDPVRGVVSWHPVAALLRHPAPEHMYRVTTGCGRTVEVTGDHNFWVLREGRLVLLKTSEVRETDCLPVPESLPALERPQRSSAAGAETTCEGDLAGTGAGRALTAAVAPRDAAGSAVALFTAADVERAPSAALLSVLGLCLARRSRRVFLSPRYIGQTQETLAPLAPGVRTQVLQICARRAVDRRLPEQWLELPDMDLAALRQGVGAPKWRAGVFGRLASLAQRKGDSARAENYRQQAARASALETSPLLMWAGN